MGGGNSSYSEESRTNEEEAGKVQGAKWSKTARTYWGSSPRYKQSKVEEDHYNIDDEIDDEMSQEQEVSAKDRRWLRPHLAIWLVGSLVVFAVTSSGVYDTPDDEGEVSEMSTMEAGLMSIVMGYPHFFLMNLCCYAPLLGTIFLSADDDLWDWPPWYVMAIFGPDDSEK